MYGFPATRPLPGFLLALRTQANLTQRELGAKLHRAAKFVYDCEAGLRRVEVGEFIEWSLACGENPLATLAAYGQALGGDWGKPRATPYPAKPLPHFSLNDKADALPDGRPITLRKKPSGSK